MRKTSSFRNFYYNYSDIMLALMLIAIAAVLVVWRINIIMDYPKTIDTKVTRTAEPKATTPAETHNETKPDTVTTGEKKATWKNDHLAGDFTIELSGKSEKQRVQLLVNAGLFTNKKEYIRICKITGVKHRKIRKGTFTFTKDMTKEKIVKLITD
ncbi:hypothetical protein AXF21_04620 [Eubacterium minutum ATCC 700079]|nr:hypothetical protein AXF21_04620 [Eubacterium minutum ATCC 700079]